MVVDTEDSMTIVLLALAAAFIGHRWLRPNLTTATPAANTTPTAFRDSPVRRSVPGGGTEAEGWIPVRLTGPEVEIETFAHPQQTVAALKAQVLGDVLGQGRRVTFIAQGQRLEDEREVGACRIRANSVVHCVLSAEGQGDMPDHQHQHHQSLTLPQLQPAQVLLGLSGMALLGFWLLCWWRPSLFNTFTTFLLGCLTVLYVGFVKHSVSPAQRPDPDVAPTGMPAQHGEEWQNDANDPDEGGTSFLTPEEIARLTTAEPID